MAIDPDQGSVAWKPTVDQVDQHDVVLRVRDNKGGLALQIWQINVERANIPPVIVSTPNLQAIVDLPYQYQVRAQDPDNETITYGLAKAPTGMAIDPTTGVVAWTPAAGQMGPHEVIVSATDERGAEILQAYDLDVLATAPNDPPQIVSTPRERVRLGNHYGYQVLAMDPNVDPLTFELVNGPDGMILGPETGLLAWTPTSDQSGNNDILIRVSDGRGGVDTQEFVIEVSTSDTNAAPVITSQPRASAIVDQADAYDLTADDPDGDPVAWSLEQGPAGMSIHPQAGTLRWTPTVDQLGTHTVTVGAIDPFGATGSQTFEINVRSTNIAPLILSVPPTQATVDQPYTYAVRAHDVECDVLSFSLTAAPAGMMIDPETGVISWTPSTADVGDHAVSILVDDGNGGQGSQAYTLVVAIEAINQAPSVTSRPTLNAPRELLYEYQVTAVDPEGDAIEYYLLESPAGMTIDRDTGLIQWTPTADQSGDYVIHIAAIDTEGAGGTQRYTLKVASNQPPTISSTASTSVMAGMVYRYAVMASDPEGDDLTYRLVQRPEGLTLNTFGLMSWQTETADLGSYDVTVEVRDPAGASDSQTFTLDVTADIEVPLVDLQIIEGLILRFDDANGEVVADLGTQLKLSVAATDNVGVDTKTLTADGTTLAIDMTGNVMYTAGTTGFVELAGSATDEAGNTTFTTRRLRVIDPTDQSAPTVIITSPEYGAAVTYLTDIMGSVYDPEGEFGQYVVSYVSVAEYNAYGVNAPNMKEIYHSNSEVHDDVLATFDPTMLRNDDYVVVVGAYDLSGNGWAEPLVISVLGEAKLGNFRLDFVDLSIPLVGIPITVTRTYDTLDAHYQGDFGYGWSLSVQDVDIRETVPDTGSGIFLATPFRVGTRVYLTTPDGRRAVLPLSPSLIERVSLV